jgi:hypothetical protein
MSASPWSVASASRLKGKHGHLEGLVVPLGTLDERVQQLLLAPRLEVAVVHRGVPSEVQDLEDEAPSSMAAYQKFLKGEKLQE